MRNALVVGALSMCLWPNGASAGDCPAHPVWLKKIEVVSCAPLSRANAPRVSRHLKPEAPPAVWAELDKVASGKNAGVVVTMKATRTRMIDIDGRDREPGPPIAEAWVTVKEPAEESAYAPATDCKAFAPKAVKVVEFPTDCGCDTGPHGDCVLNRPFLYEVDRSLAKFATEP